MPKIFQSTKYLSVPINWPLLLCFYRVLQKIVVYQFWFSVLLMFGSVDLFILRKQKISRTAITVSYISLNRMLLLPFWLKGPIAQNI